MVKGRSRKVSRLYVILEEFFYILGVFLSWLLIDPSFVAWKQGQTATPNKNKGARFSTSDYSVSQQADISHLVLHRRGGKVWAVIVYRDEVPSPAVDVNIVIVHSDHLAGLCHEEGSTAELRTLRCEGELTLHRDHVQTTCETTAPLTDVHVNHETRSRQ